MCCTRLVGNTGCKNLPSGHHRTTLLLGRIFATKTCIDNRKKLFNSNISAICRYNTVNFGPPTNGWDPFGNLGHPSKFQRVSGLGSVTAATSLTGGQPNFARCLAISWGGTVYIHFVGFCPSSSSSCSRSRRGPLRHSCAMATKNS